MESDEERDERVSSGVERRCRGGGVVRLDEEGEERGKREKGRWLNNLEVRSNSAAGRVDSGRS